MSQTENALDYGEVKEVTFLERLLVQQCGSG